MLIMGLHLLDIFSLFGRFLPHLPEGIYKRAQALTSGRSALWVGVANGLMPCGPLQAMQFYAVSSGNWLRGATSMFCFCLGTVPFMIGVGLIGSGGKVKFARPMRLVSASLILIMGLAAFSNAVALAGIGLLDSRTVDNIARQEDGVQKVYSELDFGDYPNIQVKEGVSVEWVLHTTEEKINNCNHEVIIPEYHFDISLKPGDNVIKFIPKKTGTIPYTCWMGILHRKISIVNDTTKIE